jgi:hypothetical protein
MKSGTSPNLAADHIEKASFFEVPIKVLSLLVESACLSRDVADPLVLVSAPGWKDAGCLGEVCGGFHLTQSGEGNLPAFGKSARSVWDVMRLDTCEKCVRLGQITGVYCLPRSGFQRGTLRVVVG